ncbi:MAG: transcription elongation factor GreB [Methylophilaceae bacterium]|nr:transcription elongation factor GreB [Methylophilaceae bacterium]
MVKLTVADEKNYITPEGYALLEAEFYQLYKVERPEVVRTVSWAASNGDRSENGDYIYGKRRLRQIDGRLKHVMKRMDLAEVVDSSRQVGLEKVYFGAWVALYSLTGDDEVEYRIVGKDEIELAQGWISWVSPLAKAMLGKSIGDEIGLQNTVNDDGEVTVAAQYEIIGIRYQ